VLDERCLEKSPQVHRDIPLGVAESDRVTEDLAALLLGAAGGPVASIFFSACGSSFEVMAPIGRDPISGNKRRSRLQVAFLRVSAERRLSRT